MDAIEAILTRRSVREYTNKTISDKIMKELIEAGFSAPSAGDQQPWHFIIIDDRKLLDKIPEFHPHAKMLLDCQKASGRKKRLVRCSQSLPRSFHK